MGDEPSFRIPARPERSFSRTGDLEYEGGAVFELESDGVPEGPDDDSLSNIVESVLADGPYRFGDFLELPMPLYLVRDDETRDVFRVSIRDGRVRLHVLPETESAGLRAFYRRLRSETGVDWQVRCRSEA